MGHWKEYSSVSRGVELSIIGRIWTSSSGQGERSEQQHWKSIELNNYEYIGCDIIPDVKKMGRDLDHLTYWLDISKLRAKCKFLMAGESPSQNINEDLDDVDQERDIQR